MENDTTTATTCSKCDQQPAGPGGIVCPDCLEKIKNTGRLGDGF
ncbi:hypothetical protein [Amycolatopsis acididurans]|nr:hypothetical protein [Amycolatopsis acididurans]